MPSTQTVFSRSPISSMLSMSTRTAFGSPQPGQSECVFVPSRGERVKTFSMPGLTAGVDDFAVVVSALMILSSRRSCGVAAAVDLAQLLEHVQRVDLRTDAEA